jgi:hypothetical protein
MEDRVASGQPTGRRLMEREERIPDIARLADDLLEDLQADPHGSQEHLDAVGTLGNPDVIEDDLIELCIHLAQRLIACEKLAF